MGLYPGGVWYDCYKSTGKAKDSPRNVQVMLEPE